MRTLLLMRHAKSSWDDPNWSDFERPLNKRGLSTAPFMGNVFYHNEIKVDLIVSSPAKRAKQTSVLVKESAQVGNAIQFEDRIYEASATALLYLVSEFADKNESILIVGHNPGLEEFIRILTGNYCSMPTGAVAKILLNVDSWKDLTLNKGFLETVLRPKDLMKTAD